MSFWKLSASKYLDEFFQILLKSAYYIYLSLFLLGFTGNKSGKFGGKNNRVAFVVQPLSCVQVFVTPWTAAHQASLSFIISQSLLKLMCIETVMPTNQLILCWPLLLLPSVFPSIKVFSNESALYIRWPKY